MDFRRNAQKGKGQRLLGWLIWPALILALPLFLVVAVLLVTFLLIISIPVAFKLWRAYRRFKKASAEEAGVIEGEYWVREDDYRR